MQIVKINKYILIIIIILISIFFTQYHNVKKNLTIEDIKYIKLFIEELDLDLNKPDFKSFNNELKFINLIHKKIIINIVNKEGIEIKNTREPKDIYVLKKGECYDISRLLEKIFQYYGYKTRHLSIYEKKGNIPLLNLFLKKGNDSHAISQIYTTKGWLTIDSVSDWVNSDINNIIIDINKINLNTNWKHHYPHHIFKKKYFIIYGLYSRHGGFYPPYNFIPDINFKDFVIYNLF